MNVALIADPSWLAHETALFRRLIVGLADESVGVVPVVPERALEAELSLAADRVDYPASKWPALNGLRLRRLSRTLREAGPDLLHVMDGAMGPWLTPLRRSLGIPMVVSCWSAAQVQRMLRRADDSTTILAATEGVAEAAGLQLDDGSSPSGAVVPPGVVRPSDSTREPLAAPEEAICCLMLSEGPSEVGTAAMMEGLARVRERLPQFQLFAYSLSGDDHRLWRVAQRTGLLGVFNLVAAEPGSRRLLLSVDAVVRPQAMQTVRTLTLQAMAAGRPIIAAADGVEDYLIDGETAELFDAGDADLWAARFEALAARPEQYRQLGRAGAAYVRQNYGLASYVGRMIEVYRRLIGEPMPFPKAG